MRLTVLNQIAKGLPERIGEGEDQYELRTGVFKDLERIKWYLWHGNVFQALNELQSLEMDLDAAAFESKDESSQKLLKGIEEITYLRRAQPGVRAELRGALSQRGKDRFRFRRVGDQSSRKQADGEETTDGVEPAWSTSPPANKNPRARPGVGEHLPALVSGFPPSSASQESGLTPENLPLSYFRHSPDVLSRV
jgi:hypothetical protein